MFRVPSIRGTFLALTILLTSKNPFCKSLGDVKVKKMTSRLTLMTLLSAAWMAGCSREIAVPTLWFFTASLTTFNVYGEMGAHIYL